MLILLIGMFAIANIQAQEKKLMDKYEEIALIKKIKDQFVLEMALKVLASMDVQSKVSINYGTDIHCAAENAAWTIKLGRMGEIPFWDEIAKKLPIWLEMQKAIAEAFQENGGKTLFFYPPEYDVDLGDLLPVSMYHKRFQGLAPGFEYSENLVILISLSGQIKKICSHNRQGDYFLEYRQSLAEQKLHELFIGKSIFALIKDDSQYAGPVIQRNSIDLGLDANALLLLNQQQNELWKNEDEGKSVKPVN